MRMLFCPYCGTKLDEGARFCKNCGEAISNDTQELHKAKKKQPLDANPTERKTVYEGYVHKCPNCGEALDAFSANCPSCGLEIRNRQVASSVQELVRKLELIDVKKMDTVPFEPITEASDAEVLQTESDSAMKRLIGWDFQEKQRRESAERARIAKEEERERARKERRNDALSAEKRFEKQKLLEKVNLIQNFPIPNTKEDIMEFALLVSANINAKNTVPYVVLKAWIGKLDQVYQKAMLSLDSGPDLERIKEIYQQTHNRWKAKRNWHCVKSTMAVIARSAFVIAGIILFIVALIADNHGNGSEIYELIGIILLIASAATLSRRGASYLEIVIAAGSGGLSFLLAGQLHNGSMLQLCGIVVLILSAISLFKKLAKKEE